MRFATLTLVIAFMAASMAFVTGLRADTLETGKLTQDERTFVINELVGGRHVDLIRLWCEARLKGSPPTMDRAFLEYRVNQCLAFEGKQEEFTEGLKRLAGKYPGYSESGDVQATLAKSALVEVLKMVSAAKRETDPQARQDGLSAAATQFAGLMSKIDQSVESTRKAAEDEDDDSDIAQSRDMWEHQRLFSYQLYARFLPEESSARKETYKALAENAQDFYDDRFVNFKYLSEATLWLAEAKFALGDSREAAYLFEQLIETSPSVPPPYPDVVTLFIRSIRLQGLHRYLELWNDAGKPERAVKILEQIRKNPDPDIPLEVDPEPEQTAPIRRLVLIEEAIARYAGSDEPYRGEAIFRTLIDRFTDADFRLAQPSEAEEGLLEVHAALARLVKVGIPFLSPEFFYRAGLGFKTEGDYSAAIEVFKRAIHAGTGIPSQVEWTGLSSWEIAECNYFLDRLVPAAIGYWALLEDYGQEAPPAKAAEAAQNAAAYSRRFAEEYDGAWVEIEKVATALFEEYGTGVSAELAKLQAASDAELKGDYEKARELYQSIQETVKDGGDTKPVPFYLPAQSGAAKCLIAQGTSEGDSKLVEQGIAELRALLRDAADSPDGLSVVIFTLGEALWQDGNAKAAAEVIEVIQPIVDVDSETVERIGALTRLIDAYLVLNQLEEAEPVFSLLSSKFPEASQVPRSAVELLGAYSARETTEGDRRAAELASLFLGHSAVSAEDQGVRVLLYLALILLRGDKAEEAEKWLDTSKKLAAESNDPELILSIEYAEAQSLLEQQKLRKAIEAYNALIEKYPDIKQGIAIESADVFMDLGRAYLAQYKTAPGAATAEKAADAFLNGIGILDGRLRTLGGEAPPKLMLNLYWSGWYNLFEVQKIQGQCTAVINQMKTWELMKKQVPEAWRPKFEALRRECEGR